MTRSPSISPKRKSALSQIAELMALAILRKRERKKHTSSAFQLDFAKNGSMCGGDTNPNREYSE